MFLDLNIFFSFDDIGNVVEEEHWLQNVDDSVSPAYNLFDFFRLVSETEAQFN